MPHKRSIIIEMHVFNFHRFFHAIDGFNALLGINLCILRANLLWQPKRRKQPEIEL